MYIDSGDIQILFLNHININKIRIQWLTAYHNALDQDTYLYSNNTCSKSRMVNNRHIESNIN